MCLLLANLPGFLNSRINITSGDKNTLLCRRLGQACSYTGDAPNAKTPVTEVYKSHRGGQRVSPSKGRNSSRFGSLVSLERLQKFSFFATNFEKRSGSVLLLSCLSVCSSACLCLFVHPSLRLSARTTVRSPVCPSVRPSVYMYVRPADRPTVSPSILHTVLAGKKQTKDKKKTEKNNTRVVTAKVEGRCSLNSVVI